MFCDPFAAMSRPVSYELDYFGIDVSNRFRSSACDFSKTIAIGTQHCLGDLTAAGSFWNHRFFYDSVALFVSRFRTIGVKSKIFANAL